MAVLKTRIGLFRKKQDFAPQTTEEFLRILEDEVDRLSGMVDSLLKLTSLEQVPRTDRIELSELLHQVTEDVSSLFSGKGMHISTEAAPGSIQGSRELLRRALFNLVENAVKYGPEGGEVQIHAEPDGANAAITVSDQGPRIPPELRERIFEPFFRLDTARSRDLGGTGLGLALTINRVAVSIGGAPEDPQFTIDDLLPHLGVEQSKKPLGEAIPGESLNLLIGSRPFKDDEGSDRVKLAVMDYLNQKYHIVEEDFISAELEVVPAFKAADIGFDRSLIGAYGHDDRVCGFACLAALLALGTPGKTAVCMLADKEEIGSAGVSGMKSAAFDTFVSDLCDAQRVPLKACYEKSFCLSTDVTAAYDPNFAEVYEKRNSARVNYGIGLCKYTGSRGKSGASDASAEVVAYIRRVLDEAGVVWQMAELGKVDAGGGGTVAMYMANRNITTLDAGVPVLSMHAPFETVSKLDCYETYKGMKAVFQAEK